LSDRVMKDPVPVRERDFSLLAPELGPGLGRTRRGGRSWADGLRKAVSWTVTGRVTPAAPWHRQEPRALSGSWGAVVLGTLISNPLESLGVPGAYTFADALLACSYAPVARAVLGARVRTGTKASLTVLLRPWQNQTAGRGRGPTGGSSDACQHPRGGRRSPRSGTEP
jgi:hypothetical protein